MNKIIIAATLLLGASLPGHAASLTVSASDNLYGAGHSTPPAPGGGSAGNLPPSYTFAAAPNQVLTISSVTGAATLTTAFGLFGPDGNPNYGMNLSAYGGISGLRCNGSSFLAGVFLGPTEPSDPAPASLDFRAEGLGTGFATLSPVLNQMFYIGDGLTGMGSGSQQQFNVPDTATTLYLGYPDAPGYTGVPGAYQDNDGSVTATFEVMGPPLLTITKLSAAQAQISWPASASGFTLEFTDSLRSNSWSPVTNSIATVNNQFVVIIDLDNAAQFFRLRK